MASPLDLATRQLVAAIIAAIPVVTGCDRPTEPDQAAPPTAASTQGSGSQPDTQASQPAEHRTSTVPVSLSDLFAVPPQAPEVVARVNSEAISRTELEAKLRQLQIELTAAGLPPGLGRREVLRAAVDRLVETRLQQILAAKLEVKIGPKDIDRWIADLETRMEANPAFKAFLCQAGKCDPDVLRQDAREALSAEGITEKLRARVKAETATVAEAYYQRRKSDYFEHEARQVWRIFIEASGGLPQVERDAARARAEALHQTAVKYQKDPKRFEELARGQSGGPRAKLGGTLDWVAKNTLSPAVEKSIWAAKPNTVVPLYEDGMGFWIYRVGASRPGRQRPFSEVKDSIIETVYHPILTKALHAELARLRGQQRVEILLEDLVEP